MRRRKQNDPVGYAANSLSYIVGGYQIATKHDNTSTWVDMGVTTLGIGAGIFFGAPALPAIAVAGAIYGIWSLGGGSDFINNNWGYRKP